MSVEIRNLSVTLGDNEVVSDLSTNIGVGGWLGLIGPNGAGKSTVLRAIVGTVDYRGTIVISGAVLDQQDRRMSARTVAYVPQRPQLPLLMSVRDYVMLGRTPYLSIFASESRHDLNIVDEVLERLVLGNLRHRALGEVSGGEAQRAVLGRALVQAAPILLMDEPTTGLDLGHQEQVLELTDELRHERNLTVVCAMHDLTVAAQFCDKLTLIDRGRVVMSGEVREVLSPERISKHFGASVAIIDNPEVGLIVAPQRRKR
ncbi:MAG TPA: ABC transporter ATP-binding protein [Acidimicrobiales bacterium]|nr:ABC transporter ATP-binding protein [Acidimicrobiales bacterium]